jgi:ParB family transcriptional regulator, chromosome partitioning protein
MQTSNAVTEKVAEKSGAAKVTEKLAEKRRALGRGLESLLPGPRVVVDSDPTHSHNPRMGGAASVIDDSDSSGGTPVSTVDGSASGPAGVTLSPSLNGIEADGSGVDLQAVASGKVTDGLPVFRLAVEQIDPNPHQTRQTFEEELMEELADSIRVQGVLQPIVVRPGEGGRFILILGERRLRASKIAGKTTIPAIVKRVSEQQAAEMTLVENLQREDLDCLDQAEAFANLSTRFKLTQEEIGKRVGASRETVSNYMRLLKLPIDVETALRRGDLTYSHARALLGLHDESQVSKVAQMAIKKKMSVMALEDLVLDINVPVGRPEEPRRSGARWVDPNVRAAQRSLETILGMKVRIRDRRGKGKITIEYGTLEDFDRVVRMLKGKLAGSA